MGEGDQVFRRQGGLIHGDRFGVTFRRRASWPAAAAASQRVAMASASGQSRNVYCRSGFVNNDVEALVGSRRDEIVRE